MSFRALCVRQSTPLFDVQKEVQHDTGDAMEEELQVLLYHLTALSLPRCVSYLCRPSADDAGGSRALAQYRSSPQDRKGLS